VTGFADDPGVWLARLEATHPLIQRGTGFVTAAQLSRHAEAVRLWLSGAPGGPVLLYCEDAGYFLVGLLGALAAGREIFLPGHAAAGYISEILPPDATILTDIAGLGAALHLPSLAPAADRLASLPASGRLGFFTSGSSGQPKSCPKTLHQLSAEIAAHRAFGQLRGTAVLGTVSHQHIYGMLFRILLPLATGGTIYAARLEHWETILPLLTDTSLLVSSPAHLTRLPALAHATSPAQILSSGAPLPLQAADDCARIFGRRPLEIFGSTETGGIAFRYQSQTDSDWTPLPGVEIHVNDEQHLQLRSPFTGVAAFVATGDHATLRPDGRFQLGARHDRIVKIEGKRVSLQRVEAALRSLPEIQDAAVFALDGTLATAVVLTEPGARLLAAQTPLRTRTLLRHALAGLEPAERPKRWRFVAALPVNPEGKRTQAALSALFAPASRELPVILAQTVTPEQAIFQLELTENLRWFDGHFPGQPLLPGVAQLHIAAACARLAWDRHFTGRHMARVKFRRVLAPNQRVALVLNLRKAGEMDFQYLHGDEIAASGTFKA
jgi:3-hydroxymyristoyl/3-hydroxydecanoyl-(acyl carrier protein) dehydratase